MNKFIKISSIITIIILILNIVFFALRLINELVFWIVIAISFGISFFLNKHKNKLGLQKNNVSKKSGKTKNN